jgi:diamine N-acetyltransferase
MTTRADAMRADAARADADGTTIRTAGPDDAGLLADVAAATFPLACPPGTSDRDIADFIASVLSPERFADYLADPDRVLLVAEPAEPAGASDAADGAASADAPAPRPHPDDARALGYLMLVVAEPTDPDVASVLTARPTAEVSKVYVRPEAQGGGLAGRLLAAGVAAAADRGARGVWLGVNRRNGRANAFYEKHGFGVVGPKRFLVGEQWHDDWVRERPL